MAFALVALLFAASTTAAPVRLVEQAPVGITRVAPGIDLVDFGRVAFGNLRLVPPPGARGRVTIHFGEAMRDGRVDRTPPGSVRYGRVQVALDAPTPLVAAPPADARNTRAPAVLTPSEWGVVTPFRWVEIEGWPGDLQPAQIRRRAAFASTWDDRAAAFSSSDAMLDRVWELCRYSIKATTFAGVYVDGDRERIPYEADAYLTQISHYATDTDVRMARDTFDHLVAHPTWPTEWASHMVFMAHADWWQTGDKAWLAARFERLKDKLLLERVGPDGLATSTPDQIKQGDLVDWPAGERDAFVFTRVNTVVNAFYLRALKLMAELATVVGREPDAAGYRERARVGRAAFQARFFDPGTGLYRDGVGTDHASLHANAFALAFGLVPPEHVPRLAAWLAARKMDCSVYAAQYFMEALFELGQASRALDLMLGPGDRTWRHMVESGTTITWEAWDQAYKPNQDWNHAWGAAPANLLPRFVLGVRPEAPGWSRALVAPKPGGLTAASGRVPTPRGPIEVAWTNGAAFRLRLALPAPVTAIVTLPATGKTAGVFRDGKRVAAHRHGDWWVVDAPASGRATYEAR